MIFSSSYSFFPLRFGIFVFDFLLWDEMWLICWLFLVWLDHKWMKRSQKKQNKKFFLRFFKFILYTHELWLKTTTPRKLIKIVIHTPHLFYITYSLDFRDKNKILVRIKLRRNKCHVRVITWEKRLVDQLSTSSRTSL